MICYWFRLIQALLRNTRHNYYVLKGHSLATADMTAEFLRLQMLLRCPAEVAWQDHEQAQALGRQSNTTTTTTSTTMTVTPVASGASVGASVSAAGSTGVGVGSRNQAPVSRSQDHADFESLLQFPDRNGYALSRE